MGSVLRLSVRREKAPRRNSPWRILWSSSKERREFLQRRAAASLVVFEPHARRNVIAAYGDLGAAGGGRQRGGDDHLAGESRVRGFEFDRPHDPLVGDQSHKAAVERVGAFGGLAARGPAAFGIYERHAEGPAFSRVA